VIERYLYEISKAERAAIRKRAQKSLPMPWEKVMSEVEERYQALIARGKQKRKSGLFSSEGIDSIPSPE